MLVTIGSGVSLASAYWGPRGWGGEQAHMDKIVVESTVWEQVPG